MAHDHDHDPATVPPGDEEVCVCFHVPRRKVEAWMRRERPKVISQVSQCLGAGTGCGWCISFLKAIHAELLEGGPPFEMPGRKEYLEKRKAYHRDIGYGKAAPDQETCR